MKISLDLTRLFIHFELSDTNSMMYSYSPYVFVINKFEITKATTQILTNEDLTLQALRQTQLTRLQYQVRHGRRQQ